MKTPPKLGGQKLTLVKKQLKDTQERTLRVICSYDFSTSKKMLEPFLVYK